MATTSFIPTKQDIEKYQFLKYKNTSIKNTQKTINLVALVPAAALAIISVLASIFNCDLGPIVFGMFSAIGLYIGLWVYLLPTYFAYTRCIGSRLPLMLINILTGWTLIPWIVTLIWGISGAPCWAATYKQHKEETEYNKL